MRIVAPVSITTGVLTDSNIPSNDDAAAYNPVTAYGIGDTATYNRKVYESLEAANTGNQPDENPTKWLDTGYENRWRMFDNTISSQSVRNGQIIVELTPGQLVTSVSLFNVSAESVNVRMVDPNAHEVYNQTMVLLDNSEVVDWWTYWFSPIVRRTDVVFQGLPAYTQAKIIITIEAGAADAKVGETVIGVEKVIGKTLWGVGLGIVDFSVKNTDSFGNITVVRRRNSDVVEFPVVVDTDNIYQIRKLLKSILGVPTVFIGSLDRPETYVFGYYQDSRVVMEGPDKSALSLDVQSLV